MSDRELLELAAKAAGYEALRPAMFGMDCWMVLSYGEWQPWNPLSEDGDALRLAVKLRIDLDFDDLHPIVETYRKDPEGGDCLTHTEALTPDANAATRRAIVRAAASIGASMAGAAEGGGNG